MRCTKRLYLNYPEADFEVFRPAGATRCTDGGEIWHGGCQISPPSVQGIGPPKVKFLLRFDQNVEYEHPTGVYLFRDFHKICWVCTPFQDALAVKISPKTLNLPKIVVYGMVIGSQHSEHMQMKFGM